MSIGKMTSFCVLESWLIREAGFLILTQCKQRDLGDKFFRLKSVFQGVTSARGARNIKVERHPVQFFNLRVFIKDNEYTYM